MTAPTSVPTDPSCLFCRIVSGDIPSRQVYADEHAVAFLDVAPWHRGHTLVVPRRHVADLAHGQPAMAEVAPAVDAVSRLLVERLPADGLTLLSSAGPVAGQEVLHLHLHLVPRYADRPGLGGLLQRLDVPDGDLDADLDAVHAALTGSP